MCVIPEIVDKFGIRMKPPRSWNTLKAVAGKGPSACNFRQEEWKSQSRVLEPMKIQPATLFVMAMRTDLVLGADKSYHPQPSRGRPTVCGIFVSCDIFARLRMCSINNRADGGTPATATNSPPARSDGPHAAPGAQEALYAIRLAG